MNTKQKSRILDGNQEYRIKTNDTEQKPRRRKPMILDGNQGYWIETKNTG